VHWPLYMLLLVTAQFGGQSYGFRPSLSLPLVSLVYITTPVVACNQEHTGSYETLASTPQFFI
jgi:hypothetical protein